MTATKTHAETKSKQSGTEWLSTIQTQSNNTAVFYYFENLLFTTNGSGIKKEKKRHN